MDSKYRIFVIHLHLLVMAAYHSTPHFQSKRSVSSLLQSNFLVFFLLLSFTEAISFNFANFESSPRDIHLLADAFFADGDIQITQALISKPNTRSVGRAIYNERVHLWDSATKSVADFNTNFSFTISYTDGSVPGDGLAFFLASNGSDIPSGRTSSGGYLGLFNGSNAFNGASKNRIVAIEFDNYANDWDPFYSHIGIDLNTIQSNEPWHTIFKNRGKANACISYNASARNFTIFMTYDGNFKFNGAWNFSLAVDLKKILPEWVDVGFSAATGVSFQAHSIHAWSFSSSNISDNGTNVGNNGLNTGVNAPTAGEGGMKKSKIGWVIGLEVSSGPLLCGLCLLWIILWRKRSGERKGDDLVLDLAMQEEFERGTGPRSFTYKELVSATNNFMEDRKLGEGGFGGVYKGHLSDMNLDVAVKRVKRDSRQGRKEYVSEVKIISQLRHRNLVQLIGWCHEQGELLLVYEFLPNGSLDSHLFGKKAILPWVTRYKIGMGLASALFYLHEEWKQCVVHRDIKSSNVMLDSDFNAKLGDFGLARLMDHDLGMQTTMPAGTLGYLAPECVMTGKTSKESDLFSFGIVSLELACGRKPVEYKARAEDKVSLLEWVWGLYGRGKILEAADERLSMDYDEQQMERLLVMGLWCAHPDHSLRPSIRQVINVLSFESSLPILAMKMSVPVYFAPHSHSCKLSHASTSCGYTEMGVDRSGCSCSSCCSYSSKLSESSASSSSTSLLHSQKIDI